MTFACWETDSGDKIPMLSQISAITDVLSSPVAVCAFCCFWVVFGQGVLLLRLLAIQGSPDIWLLTASVGSGVGMGASVTGTGGV